MRKLVTLSLNNNKIRDFEPVIGLHRLSTAWLWGNILVF